MEHLNLSRLDFSSKSNCSNDEILHEHDFVECFFITTGEIIHFIENQKDILSTGDGYIIAPGVPHHYQRIGACSHRDNMLSVKLFKECSDFLGNSIYENLLKQKYIKFNINLDQIQYFEKNIITYISIQDIVQKKQYEKMLGILLTGYISLPYSYSFSSLNDFHSKCITVINDNFNKPNAFELIHEQLSFNKSYLSTKFKESFGVTMTDYINELRINYATYLLSVTEYSVSHICEECGFESLPYFNKLFKQHHHITPAKYRQNFYPKKS